jgi:uncharacterized paraquat-inducible protein A
MSYWCDDCETVEEDPECSLCGADLSPAERAPIPWRWRLFLVASVIYLGWRLYQLISWLIH